MIVATIDVNPVCRFQYENATVSAKPLTKNCGIKVKHRTLSRHGKQLVKE